MLNRIKEKYKLLNDKKYVNHEGCSIFTQFGLNLILLFFVNLMTLSSRAEDINALKLHLASGKQIICMLDEKPVVSFCNEELILTTHISKVSYQSSDVLKFTYLYVEPSNINQTLMQSLFTLKDNTLSIIGVEPGSHIAVYSLDGLLVVSTWADKKGSTSIALNEQSGKVYIVKTSVANFKITRQ